jgi:hypothetical protein
MLLAYKSVIVIIFRKRERVFRVIFDKGTKDEKLRIKRNLKNLLYLQNWCTGPIYIDLPRCQLVRVKISSK